MVLVGYMGWGLIMKGFGGLYRVCFSRGSSLNRAGFKIHLTFDRMEKGFPLIVVNSLKRIEI